MASNIYNVLIQIKDNTVAASARLSKFQKTLKKVFNASIITGFTALAATSIFRFVKSLTDAAGRAETTNRRFQRTFGELADEMQKNASVISESVNRATSEIKSGLTSLQSFFQGLGFASKEAAVFSSNIQKASIDLASFYGLSDQNAQKRFIAALAGSPEVLDQFGINLKQAALQVELYNMGIKTTVQNTDELIKTQARLNIINRAMTANGILGDAVRNVDSYGNKIKALDAAFTELSESLGDNIIPSVTKFLGALTKIVKIADRLSGNSEENKVRKRLLVEKEVNSVLKERGLNVRELNNLDEEQRERILKILKEESKYFQWKVGSIEEEVNGVKTLITARDIYRGIEDVIKKIKSDQAAEEQKMADIMADYFAETEKFLEVKEKEQKREKFLAELRQKSVSELIQMKGNLTQTISILDKQAVLSNEQTDELRKQKQLHADITKIIKDRGTSLAGSMGAESDQFEDFTFDPNQDFSNADNDFPDFFKYKLDFGGEISDAITNGFSEDEISLINDVIDTFNQSLDDKLQETADLISEKAKLIKDTTESMKMSIQQGFLGFGYDVIGIIIEGGDNMLKAILESASKMALGLSQQLATQAIYHNFMLSAALATGNFVKAVSHATAAGILTKGAILLGAGGIAAGLGARSMGGGTASNVRQFNNGQPTNLNGQSSFGQVLAAEVSGDKLRFVLQESDRRRFRRNG